MKLSRKEVAGISNKKQWCDIVRQNKIDAFADWLQNILNSDNPTETFHQIHQKRLADQSHYFMDYDLRENLVELRNSDNPDHHKTLLKSLKTSRWLIDVFFKENKHSQNNRDYLMRQDSETICDFLTEHNVLYAYGQAGCGLSEFQELLEKLDTPQRQRLVDEAVYQDGSPYAKGLLNQMGIMDIKGWIAQGDIDNPPAPEGNYLTDGVE